MTRGPPSSQKLALPKAKKPTFNSKYIMLNESLIIVTPAQARGVANAKPALIKRASGLRDMRSRNGRANNSIPISTIAIIAADPYELSPK
jgi:hypothetical protein